MFYNGWMALSTTTNSGAQTGAQGNLTQPATQGGISGTSTGAVQTGTADSLLTSNNGISLNNTPVTTVSLTGSTQSQSPRQDTAAHHMNYALLGFSILLFVVAVGLFWATGRTEKNTTK